MNKNFIDRLKKTFGKDSLKVSAKKTGVPAATLGRYTKGQTEPELKKLLKIAEGYGIGVGWLAAGENPKNIPNNGDIAASISPEDELTRAKLLQQQNKPTTKNIHLLQLVEWMDENFGEGNEDQALFFYEDIKARYPSFEEFMEKKRPRQNTMPSQTQKANRKTG